MFKIDDDASSDVLDSYGFLMDWLSNPFVSLW
jgi:hypothetical protein